LNYIGSSDSIVMYIFTVIYTFFMRMSIEVLCLLSFISPMSNDFNFYSLHKFAPSTFIYSYIFLSPKLLSKIHSIKKSSFFCSCNVLMAIDIVSHQLLLFIGRLETSCVMNTNFMDAQYFFDFFFYLFNKFSSC
jgi:hypothetical protein